MGYAKNVIIGVLNALTALQIVQSALGKIEILPSNVSAMLVSFTMSSHRSAVNAWIHTVQNANRMECALNAKNNFI